MSLTSKITSHRTMIVALTVALVAPVLSAAESHVVKVIAAPGVLDAGAEGIELWHDYGAYALYRVLESALQQLPPEVRATLALTEETDHLWLLDAADTGRADVRTHDGGDSEPGEGEAAGKGYAAEPALHLVRFVGPIQDEWLRSVEVTGATLVHYIAPYGYLLWADGGARGQLARMAAEGDFVQESAPYPNDRKVGPALGARFDRGDDPATVVPVLIQMYRHDDRMATEALIDQGAVAVIAGWQPILSYQNIIITVRLGDVWEMALRPDVYWIEERLERRLMDEVQGQIVAGNFNVDQSGPSGPGYLPWLGGYGFSTDPADYPIVDVTDDGIGNGTVNSGDPTLHQFGDLVNPTRLAYVANCTSSPDGGGPDGHGHLNVSIAGGYDTRAGFPYLDPLGYQRGLGINPFGRFAGTRLFNPVFNASACGGTDTGVIKSVQDNGALINTNSWGCASCAGSYDDSSQAYDVGVRDADLTEPGNQQMIMVFSAGNTGPSSGTVGTPGNGKNMITVGASENQRPSDEDGAWTDGCGIDPTGADDAMDVISFSSRGPSPGSRFKPEVIAPGTHIQGTASTHPAYTGASVCDQYRPSGQTVFAASSGTSHSTPAVAGTLSLAYWWLENTLGVAAPSPALMKAYLLAHPTYLTGVSANDTLPSNSQGYGMPNMTELFDDADKYLIDQSVVFDNSGEAWVWQGEVVDPSRPVRIVLAYTDAPGAIGTSPQVNDLNLAADVGGAAYLGNVFSGPWSVTGGAADPFNNSEAIFLPPGTSGAIEITITGFNIAGDGVPNIGDGTDQDFALVCYNCSQIPTFSISVEPMMLDVCAPNDAVYTVDIGSILGFSDPVTLSASGHPAGTTASFSVNPVVPPGSSLLTIGGTGAASAGFYAIDVTATSTTGSQSRSVDLNLFTVVPTAPTLLTPSDGAIDVPFRPTFSWTAVAQASSYLVEVATDAGFSSIVYAAGETGTSHTTAVPLSAFTTFYWRVTAQNVCGSGISTTFSFTTQAATMVCNGPSVDFEDLIPSDWTVVSNAPGGIVWVTTADPACGIPNRTNGTGEAACADSDAAGSPAIPYDTELISNPVDLTAVGAAALDVKAYYRDITTGSNDRFEVDVWDGAVWTNELSWDEDHEPEDFSLNLSAYAGLPTVQVRFRYLGDGYDWYAQVDDIALTCVPAAEPVIEVDPAALALSQGPDVVATTPITVTNSGGSPLEWLILEDDSPCDSPTDVPWLSVAPAAGTTVPLDSTVIDATFDSTGLAPGGYAANLCFNSNDPVNPVIQVPATLTVEPPELLVCNGPAIAFETGIPAGWQVVDNTGGTGIVWVTTADPACGQPNLTNGTGEAACADSDAAGLPAIPYDTELVSPPIDLTGAGAAVLDVKAYYRDITTGSNDRFEVDVWDGAVWTNELSWDEDHQPEDFTLDLSAYTGLSSVRVRFRYFGNGWDYYAQVDDIQLLCTGGPDINVDPLSLGSTQQPDTQSTRNLGIENLGSAELEWLITEDAGMPESVLIDWYDDFDSYPTGSQMHGQGGWKGWGNDPSFGALTSDLYSRSAPNSVDIFGSSDLVREYTGADSGYWILTAWQYIPTGYTGETYFVLLNQYDDSGATNNWSTQVHFDGSLDLVIADMVGAGPPLTLVRDAWVELRVEIDLINDIQEFFYDGILLSQGSWTGGVSGGGSLNIGAVDLFANGSSSVYYDDMSLVRQATVCLAPTDIPWLSVDPVSGTVPAGESQAVDVTFDSTGLGAGTYGGNLCVGSNDPNPGPGNGTDLVIVPVNLTVTGEPEPLLCNGSTVAFSFGPPPDWTVIDNEGQGLVWSNLDSCGEAGNYTNGSGDCACASSDIFGSGIEYDTEMWSPPFNTMDQRVVFLNFTANYADLSSGGDTFAVDVSTDGGATWNNVLVWDEDHGGDHEPPGEDVMIDISTFVGDQPSVIVRFHYFTLAADPWDWYVQVDDASLFCDIPVKLMSFTVE